MNLQKPKRKYKQETKGKTLKKWKANQNRKNRKKLQNLLGI